MLQITFCNLTVLVQGLLLIKDKYGIYEEEYQNLLRLWSSLIPRLLPMFFYMGKSLGTRLGPCMWIKDSRILSGLFLFLTQQTDRRMIPVHVRKTSRRNAVQQAMISPRNAVIVVPCIPGSVVLWLVEFSDATAWKRKFGVERATIFVI